jgi:hypothetical protein
MARNVRARAGGAIGAIGAIGAHHRVAGHPETLLDEAAAER